MSIPHEAYLAISAKHRASFGKLLEAREMEIEPVGEG
jgi:hypothetical protein